MTILETIVEHKRVEVLKRKQKRPLANLQGFALYSRETVKIEAVDFNMKPGIIAEFKRKSPSKGVINSVADPVKVSEGYVSAGVAGMSILTDRDFFGGSFRDLTLVKQAHPGLPLLRKDFIIDPYQVHETKAYGADIILLIAAILSGEEVKDLARLAGSLGLQVLFEVHDRRDLGKYADGIEMVGVNNRDLRTFSVDINQSLQLIDHFPEGVIPVSESGISGQNEINLLFNQGFKLFLIGETFMREKNPGKACQNFLQQL